MKSQPNITQKFVAKLERLDGDSCSESFGCMNMKKILLRKFILYLFLGLGFVLVISPVALYWFIHGDYHRYFWIINGPYPFSSLGGGPFQMLVYAGLFILGISLILLAIILRTKTRKL